MRNHSARSFKHLGLVLMAGAMGVGLTVAATPPASASVFDVGRFLSQYTDFTVMEAQAAPLHTVSAGANVRGAEQFIERMAGDAIEFLGDDSRSYEQKRASFRQLLETSFDMDTIGRFALGRYWRTATPEQQQEYMNLFKQRVIDVYSARFQEYTGQRFETRGARPEGQNDAIVHSAIVPRDGSQQVRVDWRVRERNGQFRIIDIIVEGVSMSVTQRSDFSSVIQRGGGNVQVLIDHLRRGTAPVTVPD